ncbi:MAG: sodium:proton antiporter [Chitinophagales bacterium]|nr:MAG: sodium:proton antiporter [Chitinophagales bacterium]
MELPLVIIFLGVLIIGAHVLHELFDRIRIPNALLLTLVGILIGPVLHLVKLEHFGKIGPVFTNLTLIIIIFVSGINLKLKELGQAVGPSLIFGLMNFLFTAGIISGLAYMGGASGWLEASFIGAILGGTSSAVVIPMINQIKMNQKGSAILLLESALTDVLCLVLGITLLSAMKEGVFSAGAMAAALWQSFLFALLLGMLAAVLWGVLLIRLTQPSNSTILNLAVLFVVSGTADILGWNGGIAALSFGIALGNIELLKRVLPQKWFYNRKSAPIEKGFLDEIAFVLQTYFFVYLGVSIRFGIPQLYALATLAVALILLLRPLSVRAAVWSKMPLTDLSVMSVMMPKGLVPAILASLPLQMGLSDGEYIRDFAYSVVLVSLVLCSGLVILIYNNLYFPGLLRWFFTGIVEEAPASDKNKEHPGIPAEQTSVNINTEAPAAGNTSAASASSDVNKDIQSG